MKFIPWVAAALALGFLAQRGSADTFSINGQSYTTQYNTGSGADGALMVLEYGASSYAFGYRWNPASAAPSGYDMLNAIAANSGGSMTLNVSFFDFGDGPEPQINTIGYLTDQPVADYPNAWFNYFTADGGGDWISSDLGVGQRILASGSADDWVFQDVPPDENFNPLVLPNFAIAVPEPASLGLLGIGLLLSWRRRRRAGR